MVRIRLGNRKGEKQEYNHVKIGKWGKWSCRDTEKIMLAGDCADTDCDGGTEAESGAVYVGVP